MSMYRVTMTMLCLLLYPCTARPQTAVPTLVALLPIQSEQADRPGILNEQLSTALLVELTRTGEVQLVQTFELEQAIETTLIDEAVFELLVTDNLTRTLEKLDSLSCENGRHNAYAETARRLGADYMIEVTIQASRYRTEVNYRLTDTITSRVALAQSFVSSLGYPKGLARETANRVTRGLWKLKHRSQSGS